MKIYKYPLEITAVQELRLPKGATILDLQVNNDVPCIWAMIPEDKFGEMGHNDIRTFITIGTGHEFVHVPKNIYIGTYQKYMMGNIFVGHVFERI